MIKTKGESKMNMVFYLIVIFSAIAIWAASVGGFSIVGKMFNNGVKKIKETINVEEEKDE